MGLIVRGRLNHHLAAVLDLPERAVEHHVQAILRDFELPKAPSPHPGVTAQDISTLAGPLTHPNPTRTREAARLIEAACAPETAPAPEPTSSHAREASPGHQTVTPSELAPTSRPQADKTPPAQDAAEPGPAGEAQSAHETPSEPAGAEVPVSALGLMAVREAARGLDVAAESGTALEGEAPSVGAAASAREAALVREEDSGREAVTPREMASVAGTLPIGGAAHARQTPRTREAAVESATAPMNEKASTREAPSVGAAASACGAALVREEDSGRGVATPREVITSGEAGTASGTLPAGGAVPAPRATSTCEMAAAHETRVRDAGSESVAATPRQVVPAVETLPEGEAAPGRRPPLTSEAAADPETASRGAAASEGEVALVREAGIRGEAASPAGTLPTGEEVTVPRAPLMHEMAAAPEAGPAGEGSAGERDSARGATLVPETEPAVGAFDSIIIAASRVKTSASKNGLHKPGMGGHSSEDAGVGREAAPVRAAAALEAAALREIVRRRGLEAGAASGTARERETADAGEVASVGEVAPERGVAAPEAGVLGGVVAESSGEVAAASDLAAAGEAGGRRGRRLSLPARKGKGLNAEVGVVAAACGPRPRAGRKRAALIVGPFTSVVLGGAAVSYYAQPLETVRKARPRPTTDALSPLAAFGVATRRSRGAFLGVTRERSTLPGGVATATSFWDPATARGARMSYATVASPYWPLGTRVQISYRGRSVVGVVQDFGPADWAIAQHEIPAIIDLSEAMMADLTGSREHAIEVRFQVLEWGRGDVYRASGPGYDLATGRG
ncbi:hypothetical protein [Actinomadura barringtoniae]|uniref:hypothetical protein n=1 Tax=Actinomadura barringtoniae TaxID=1427535 RepID=UPI00355881EC